MNAVSLTITKVIIYLKQFEIHSEILLSWHYGLASRFHRTYLMCVRTQNVLTILYSANSKNQSLIRNFQR